MPADLEAAWNDLHDAKPPGVSAPSRDAGQRGGATCRGQEASGWAAAGLVARGVRGRRLGEIGDGRAAE